MNFFQEVSKAVSKINYYGNMTHQNNLFGSGSNDNNLVSLVKSCTYTDDVKFLVQKSAKQLLHVYPQYRPEILQFIENNYQKRYLEIKGQLMFEGGAKISFNIMFPATFPKQSPYVRIINPNPNQYRVTQYYKDIQSMNDPKSFILNTRLNQIKSWNPQKSVVSIVIQINNMMKNYFPFEKINQNQYHNQWNAQNNGWGGNNQWANINQNKIGMGGMGALRPNSPSKKPPIPFQNSNNTFNTADLINRSHLMVTKEKKILDSLKISHNKVLETIQNLDQTQYSLSSEVDHLAIANHDLVIFIENNSKSDEQTNLSNLIQPADKLSDQILDLTSSIKARQECLMLLEQKFSQEIIPLEQFLKHMRKIEEARFEQKYLLNKCLHSHD